MLIAVEGIDGSGKGTQATVLAERLTREGAAVCLIRFPQYQDTLFGREVGHYLNGDFGALDAVPAKFSSLLYAMDRFQALDKITKALDDGKVVICDRYTGSNIAHQAARVPRDERPALISWIQEVEEEILSIPTPDLVIFLDMEVSRSQMLVSKKDKRSYTEKTHDLHESSADHLQIALENFRFLANELNWVHISCVDDVGSLKSVALVGEEIYSEVLRVKNCAR